MFEGVFKGFVFITVVLIIIVGQIIIVNFGGSVTSTVQISFVQWLGCILIGSFSIPFGNVLRAYFNFVCFIVKSSSIDPFLTSFFRSTILLFVCFFVYRIFDHVSSLRKGRWDLWIQTTFWRDGAREHVQWWIWRFTARNEEWTIDSRGYFIAKFFFWCFFLIFNMCYMEESCLPILFPAFECSLFLHFIVSFAISFYSLAS